jgi:hypothetical protein
VTPRPLSNRPCGAAPCAVTKGNVERRRGRAVDRPDRASPASIPCVSRAEVSAAGGRVGIRAAGARSVEGIEPGDGGAGREVAARRGTK